MGIPIRRQSFDALPVDHEQNEQTHRHILVVDDDPFIVKLIQEYLEVMGHNVSCAYDGQAALVLAKSSKPNLIILDVNMPMINGLKTLEYLRKLEDTKNIPVLFLSGESSFKLTPALASVPRLSYVKKPIDLEDLNSIVKHLIETYPT
jgi:CheY-like chemotaxis protein